MTSIRCICGTFEIESGLCTEPLTWKTLVIPDDTEFDEYGQAIVNDVLIHFDKVRDMAVEFALGLSGGYTDIDFAPDVQGILLANINSLYEDEG